MLPDAAQHDPRPDYLRQLCRRIGWSQRAIAMSLGIAPRTLEAYLSNARHHRRAPYVVQYGLEVLAVVQSERRDIFRTMCGRVAEN